MKKVVIVGAGPAGITAAYELLKSNEEFDVTILEETSAIGGMSGSIEHNGNIMDVGGHNFYSENKRVVAWLENILPVQSAGHDPEKEDAVMLRRRMVSSRWDAERVKKFSLIAALKEFIARLTKKGDNEEADTNLEEKLFYPKFGPGQLWETAADEVLKMGGKIMKNCRVKKIVNENGRITALQYMENNKSRVMMCDVLVSTMPIKDLVAGLNGVPEKVANIASNLSYHGVVTVGLLSDGLNIKSTSKSLIVPDCTICVDDKNVKLDKIQIFNNFSPYMVKDTKKNVWLGAEYFCSEGDDFWNMEDDECISFAADELVKLGVIKKNAKISDSHCEKVEKAFPVCSEIDELIAYLNEFENLYCIGRNGQYRSHNMEMSMKTAFEAVENIITGRKDKLNIWNVNKENN